MDHRRPGSSDDDLNVGQRVGGLHGTPPDSFGGAAPFGSATPFDDTRPFMPEIDPSPADAPADRARLRVEYGSVDRADILLSRQTLVLGRRLTNDIVIHDTNVSRQHARLVLGPNGYSVEDTQSSNGTFVNDERITRPRALQTGDAIRIGDAAFTYEAIEPAADVDEAIEPPVYQFAPAEFVPADADEHVADVGRTDGNIPDGNRVIEFPDGGRFAEHDADDRPSDDDRLSSDEANVPRRDALDDDDRGRRPAEEVLGEVQRDLNTLADTAARLADRVSGLAGTLGEHPSPAYRVEADPSNEGAVALVELRRLLQELHAEGDADAAIATANLLEQVSESPRDVELLLSVARQAPLLAAIARHHALLVRLAPLLDDVLGDRID